MSKVFCEHDNIRHINHISKNQADNNIELINNIELHSSNRRRVILRASKSGDMQEPALRRIAILIILMVRRTFLAINFTDAARIGGAHFCIGRLRTRRRGRKSEESR